MKTYIELPLMYFFLKKLKAGRTIHSDTPSRFLLLVVFFQFYVQTYQSKINFSYFLNFEIKSSSIS